MMLKIYTRTGDGGQTSVLSGVGFAPKSSGLIAALGAVDKVNAIVGWVGVLAVERNSKSLDRIQSRLFDIGAWIASCDITDVSESQNLDELTGDIERLEAEIDDNTENVPPLSNFVLPGGGELAARLHILRGEVRHAEHVVWLHIPKKTNVHIYLNRLSDWAFAEARRVLHDDGKADVIWRKGGLV